MKKLEAAVPQNKIWPTLNHVLTDSGDCAPEGDVDSEAKDV